MALLPAVSVRSAKCGYPTRGPENEVRTLGLGAFGLDALVSDALHASFGFLDKEGSSFRV